MSDIHIRTEGRAGRITFTRAKALNAMSWDMCLAIEAAIDDWRADDAVTVVLIDAEGEKAFCAGGDIQQLYETGRAGDYAYGRRFWRDEYRLNAKLSEYPKPVVSLMQGFTMGGGVGIGCHGSHRIVCDSSRIAMPECGIGLVPDVGGSLILAGAPQRMGEYLGLTGARMGPADAILAGFADMHIDLNKWAELSEIVCNTGEVKVLSEVATTPPDGKLANLPQAVHDAFARSGLKGIAQALDKLEDDAAVEARAALGRNSPLSMACALRMIRALRSNTVADIRAALTQEYRYTHRAMETGDFLEGIRAAVIDKDRNPQWQHLLDTLPDSAVEAMLAPLGADELNFEEETQ